MDIIQRNLFKVLRNGAFNTYDKLEPMSAHKWERLYQLAVMHNVIPYAYKGIENSRDQFFMHLTERQEKEWQKAYSETAHAPHVVTHHQSGQTYPQRRYAHPPAPGTRHLYKAPRH